MEERAPQSTSRDRRSVRALRTAVDVRRWLARVEHTRRRVHPISENLAMRSIVAPLRSMGFFTIGFTLVACMSNQECDNVDCVTPSLRVQATSSPIQSLSVSGSGCSAAWLVCSTPTTSIDGCTFAFVMNVQAGTCVLDGRLKNGASFHRVSTLVDHDGGCCTLPTAPDVAL